MRCNSLNLFFVLDVPITWCPRSRSFGMSFLPKTPVAPARNIRIPISPFANLDENVYRFVTAQ
jgi:hypothetical protein